MRAEEAHGWRSQPWPPRQIQADLRADPGFGKGGAMDTDFGKKGVLFFIHMGQCLCIFFFFFFF